MKPGYYIIKHLGYLLTARFDGERWHHEHGTSFAHPEHDNVCKDEEGNPVQINVAAHTNAGGGCPAGCSCSINPDGSVTVKCT